MTSRTRKAQFLAVMMLGLGGLFAIPKEGLAARAALASTLWVETSDVDLDRVCENHGCTPNAPSCYASACPPLFGASVTCNPI